MSYFPRAAHARLQTVQTSAVEQKHTQLAQLTLTQPLLHNASWERAVAAQMTQNIFC